MFYPRHKVFFFFFNIYFLDVFSLLVTSENTQDGVVIKAKTCLLLNVFQIYGFQRDTDARKSKDSKDKDSCRWSHEDFHPGRRDLLHRIRRKPTKSTRRRVVKVEDSETILKMQEEEDSADDDMDQRRSSSSASSVHGLDYASPYESQSNSLIHVTLPKPTALPDEFDFMGAESEREIDQDIASELITAQRRFDELQAFYKSRLAEQQLRIRNLENALCCYPEVKQPMLTSMAAETYYAPYDMNMPFDNTHNNTMNQPVQQSHWMQPNNSSYTP
ncbi:hypothetical protein BY458DRAFT_440301 [Sporodiniella umbellata]|nr:hypothetical protein BY458DRAFT_440301 [Sporodiniella umbellata]